MIPVKQSIHDCPDSEDSLRACVASLLDTYLMLVPNFNLFAPDPIVSANKWLSHKGICLFYCDRPFDKGYQICRGRISNKIIHSVIYKDGSMYFDPSNNKTVFIIGKDKPLNFYSLEAI